MKATTTVLTPWLDAVRSTLERWRSAGLGPAWVVAVSGGSDSVGLLRVLHALAPGLGLELSVAHLDHGVRGEPARLDAALVATLAGDLGLPFAQGRWQPARAGHFEADARRARYAWLEEVARARGASVVAVGHTRDDQAETILHRILRGTGPRGLSGMPARRPLGGTLTLVRPLLDVSRAEVRAYLGAISQPYRDDATNADLSRTRARIRHDLLPRLAAEYNPRAAEALVRLGRLTAASERAGRRLARELEQAATLTSGPGRLVLLRDRLRELPPFLRAEVLRRAWRRAGWPEGSMSARRWERLAALVEQPGGRTSIGAGVDASADEAFLTLDRRAALEEPTQASIPQDPVPLEIPGTAGWLGGWVVSSIEPEGPRVEACDAPSAETIDLDRLALPLQVRAPRPGDRFEPLGMGGRSTPLNDFFRARRVPRARRATTPLVCDRQGIVWVAGHRIAHRARVTESTRRTLRLRWRPADGAP